MFRPVKTQKVYEKIVEQIKQLIIDGQLQPGDKLLSERELADTLNVSRASLREALTALEIMGIISIRPGEGSFVRRASFEEMMEPLSFFLQVEIDDIMQVLEVRKILEVEAVALAATRATEEELEAIRKAVESMVEQIETGEIGEVADADFHFAVARAANNPILMSLMNTISDLMTNVFRSSRQKMFLIENMPETLYQAHYGIYEAIVSHDPKQAQQRMRDHLAMVEEVMLHIKQGGLLSLKDYRAIDSEKYKIKEQFGFPS